jgi:hypothetical protein
MHKILYLFIYDTFIEIIYMFRAVRCTSSGGLNVSMQHLVSSLSVGDCPVHRLTGAQDSHIPDSVIGIFQLHNPSGRTMSLGSTQPLTEMSTRNISYG